MLIRREGPGDAAAIREITVAAFGRTAEATLVDELRESEARLPALSLVAEPLVTLLGDPGYYRRFGFRLSEEYQISPPVAGWRAHFQVRALTGYRPAVRGTFRYAEPFDRV